MSKGFLSGSKPRKLRNDPDRVLRTIKAALAASHFIKENKGEFVKLLERESGVRDPAVAALIHEEIIKLYSDTGPVSDEVIQEFIVNSKEALKTTRQVSASEIADFSFARRAAADLKEGK